MQWTQFNSTDSNAEMETEIEHKLFNDLYQNK